MKLYKYGVLVHDSENGIIHAEKMNQVLKEYGIPEGNYKGFGFDNLGRVFLLDDYGDYTILSSEWSVELQMSEISY